jgi:RNAse (barnase) inhibitor barstar
MSSDPPSNTVYEIDGRRFSTLEDFYAEVSRVVIPGADWGHNLDGFNDILRGGFGTLDGGFTVRWLQHAVSKERLGYRCVAGAPAPRGSWHPPARKRRGLSSGGDKAARRLILTRARDDSDRDDRADRRSP